MYAAIRRYELGSGSADDLIHIVDEGFADVLAAEPGFLGYHVVASGVSMTGEDEIVAISFFNDKDSATRSNKVAAEFVAERLEQFGLHLTSALSGQVILTRGTPAVA